MATCRGKTEPPMKVADFANVSLAKTRSRLDEWATVMRARERNVPRTRSVGCSSRGAQNPHRPHTRDLVALRQQLALLRRRSKRPKFGLLDRAFWMWPRVSA